jgi:hypothetical protein
MRMELSLTRLLLLIVCDAKLLKNFLLVALLSLIPRLSEPTRPVFNGLLSAKRLFLVS